MRICKSWRIFTYLSQNVKLKVMHTCEIALRWLKNPSHESCLSFCLHLQWCWPCSYHLQPLGGYNSCQGGYFPEGLGLRSVLLHTLLQHMHTHTHAQTPVLTHSKPRKEMLTAHTLQGWASVWRKVPLSVPQYPSSPCEQQRLDSLCETEAVKRQCVHTCKCLCESSPSRSPLPPPRFRVWARGVSHLPTTLRQNEDCLAASVYCLVLMW